MAKQLWKTPRLVSLDSGSEAFGRKIPFYFEFFILSDDHANEEPEGES